MPVITNAGEYLITEQQQKGEALIIDKMILANIAGLDSDTLPSRDQSMPDDVKIIKPITKDGLLNTNTVVYSTVFESTDGTFNFNWMGLYSSVHDVIVAVAYVPLQTKIKTVGTDVGNVITKNFAIEFNAAADITGINISAESWQIDYTARLMSMDKHQRDLVKNIYGPSTFLNDAFKVKFETDTYYLTAGKAILGGINFELEADLEIVPGTLPQTVWLDVYQETSMMGVLNKHDVVINDGTVLTDYVAGSVEHTLVKLGVVNSSVDIVDSRSLVKKSLELRTKKDEVANIAELRNTKPEYLGQKIHVTSYYDGWAATVRGPVGGGDFIYDDSGDTNADDKGKTIIAFGGYRWKRIIESFACPEMWGAFGNNIDDDYFALKACNLSGLNEIKYSDVGYYSSNTVPFASKTKYRGVLGKTEIRTDKANAPVGCSQSYLSSESISPTGYMDIDNIRFVGDIENIEGQIGFVLRDFYSKIGDGCSFINCRGGGFHGLTKNDAGVSVSGTLVENKLGGFTVRNCGGIGLMIGENNNNKMTDGYGNDFIIAMNNEYGDRHLYVGSAAGWNIKGFHTYGKPDASSPVVINNCFNTFIDGYIESFSDVGASIHIQRNSEINIRTKTTSSVISGASAIVLSKSSAYSEANSKVNLLLSHDGNDVDVIGVSTVSNSIDLDVTTAVEGLYKSRITRVAYLNKEQFDNTRQSNVNLSGRLSDNFSNGDNVSFNDFTLSYSAASNKVIDVFSFDIELPRMVSYRKMIIDVSVIADTFDSGEVSASFVGKVCISSKNNGVDDWSVKVLEMIVPSGFTVNPSFSIYQIDSDKGRLTVSGELPEDQTGTVVALIPAPSSNHRFI